jgi:hypothetical protein
MYAGPSVAVFWTALISCFPGILSRYYLNDFEMALVTPGLTCIFTFYVSCISVVNSLYFRAFSASFFFTRLSPGIATYVNIHISFSLLRFVATMVISVYICFFHKLPFLFFIITVITSLLLLSSSYHVFNDYRYTTVLQLSNLHALH